VQPGSNIEGNIENAMANATSLSHLASGPIGGPNHACQDHLNRDHLFAADGQLIHIRRAFADKLSITDILLPK